MFNATFNNISVLSWRSVLLVEETGVPGDNPSQPESALGVVGPYRKIINADFCKTYSVLCVCEQPRIDNYSAESLTGGTPLESIGQIRLLLRPALPTMYYMYIHTLYN